MNAVAAIPSAPPKRTPGVRCIRNPFCIRREINVLRRNPREIWRPLAGFGIVAPQLAPLLIADDIDLFAIRAKGRGQGTQLAGGEPYRFR